MLLKQPGRIRETLEGMPSRIWRSYRHICELEQVFGLHSDGCRRTTTLRRLLCRLA